MKSSTLWRIAQYIGNALLIIWVLQFTPNLWILIPIMLISIWSFSFGIIISSLGYEILFFHIVGNILLYIWVLQFTSNFWILIPIMLLSVWNFIDGNTRK